MNSKVLKELFIIILLLMVILFVLGILFYDYIPKGNELINSPKYVADEDVLSTIDEIKANSGDNITEEKNNSLIKSYSIDKNDLTEYASDKSYESGKKDPFAEVSEPVEETVTTQKTGATTNNSQTSNPIKTDETKENKNQSVSNKVEAKNNTTKESEKNTVEKTNSTTGTFFEKKNSK